MDFSTAYAIYMTVAILVVGLWAARIPHEDVKVVFILGLGYHAPECHRLGLGHG